MAMEPLVLVVNPGSASRKYALFAGDQLRARIHIEFENERVVGTLFDDTAKYPFVLDDDSLDTVSRHVLPMFRQHDVLRGDEAIAAIAVRVVAPGKAFMQDQLVTEELLEILEQIQVKAPLHIGVTLAEIKSLRTHLQDIPCIAVSDSAFHHTKRPEAWRYGISEELAERTDVRRYGYHGVSIQSVVRTLTASGILPEKMVVCHLGSGGSVTAVQSGRSVDTTMGYSPLEGIVMATRSGTIDVAAVSRIKDELQLDDQGLERYLNTLGGLLGVSGSSNDIRVLLDREQHDERARSALDLYVYRVQQAIASMVASMNGVDALVFTATVGERSAVIRQRIVEGLSYLDLLIDTSANNAAVEPDHISAISTAGHKSIYIVPTDELTELARRATALIA